MTDGFFGPYRLLERIPDDGPGLLYRAEDRLRGKSVALRIFEPEPSTPEWRCRTWEALREHPDPGWAAGYTHGRFNGRTFVASAWLAAPTLADELSRGRIAFDTASVHLDQLAAALDRAHGWGAVHGCLLPQHVRLTADGPVLTDFAAAVVPGSREADREALAQLVRLCGGRRAAAATPAAAKGRTTHWWSPPVVAPPAVPAPAGPAASATWWQRRGPAGHHGAVGARLTIGRDPGCDVVLDDLLVARRHAELRREGNTWHIVDTASWTGTFVNGQRVRQAPIGPRDVIGIGHALLVLVGDRLEEYRDTGEIRFRADRLAVVAKSRTLLDGVGFELEERCLMAVVGPSGAGKSTLLKALTGLRPADAGAVWYEGRDLYDNYDELRQRIGLVPQDDILHTQLAVRTALRFAARLRFPPGTTAAEQEHRIVEVLDQLGLAGAVTDQRISTLSGGQRKRVSVALELLTSPSLLFLDEPTTGLDPGTAREVMRVLRTLADEGRTIVTVTHDMQSLELCDRLLVLAKGGQLAYFGPPREVLPYFGVADLPDLFDLLNNDDGTAWGARFAASPEAARHAPPGLPGVPPRPGAARPPRPQPARQPVSAQFRVLCHRYLAVIAADRFYALFLLALPVLLGLVVRMMPGEQGLSVSHRGPTGGPEQLLLVLVVAGAFAGFAGAFRELVKERAIYEREAAIGLSRRAYLASKITVLGVVGLVQAVVIAGIGLVGQRPPDDPPLLAGSAGVVVAIVTVTVVMMGLGLLVSALIANENRGMPLLVLVVMLQIVLCGQLFPLHDRAGLEQAAWLVPARWAYAMSASNAGLSGPPGTAADPLWSHGAGPYLLDLVVLVGLGVAFVGATALVLRRREPRRPS